MRSGFDNLFHKSVSAFPTMLIGLKGSGSLLFLGDIHDVSARRKRMRKHELMLFQVISLYHTETDFQLQGTTITHATLRHLSRSLVHFCTTTFLKICKRLNRFISDSTTLP